MLRLLVIFIILSACASNGLAQDMMFDAMHPTDGAIFLKTIDGEEVPVDIHGNIIPPNAAFKLTTSQQIERGWANSVGARSHLKDTRNAIGPTFNITYLDQVNANGKGFDDSALGGQRRAALEAAFQYYASLLEDHGQADIEVRESFSGNPLSNPFAYSAAYYYGSKGFNTPFTQAHISTGNDPYAPYPDGYVQFNFHSNLKYNYDVHANPSSDEFDFYTVALHEILHVLGFTSYSDAKGQSEAAEYVYTSFDEYLFDHNKSEVFEVTGSGSSTAVLAPPDNNALTNNQVWFELYPGQFAPVFSPNPFNGSSLDHFDNGRSDHGEYLMHPSLSKGQAFKLLHEDEARVLETLGYTVNYSIATSIDAPSVVDATANVLSGLYPNPARSHDRIQIELGDVQGEEVLVIVYDMMGRESYSKVILTRGAGPVTAIDPHNNLPPGMYIVVGSTKDELFNEKLVIK